MSSAAALAQVGEHAVERCEGLDQTRGEHDAVHAALIDAPKLTSGGPCCAPF